MDSNWYDTVYKKSVEDPGGPIYIKNHLKFIAKYCVGSVLDLGCGLGLLADMLPEQSYMGIDFSHYGIEHARKNIKNRKAVFICANLEDVLKEKKLFYDTIVLSEVLEHINFPRQLADYSISHYIKRLVGSVPVNMPIKSHVKPNWAKKDIYSMFGDNPFLLEQGCANSKRINIHWHFVYQK